MIKINNLRKTFNKKGSNSIKAVDGITLELPENGLIALFGKSGCGKTTLLNLIGGLDKADGGEVDIGGEKVKKYNSKQWDMLRNKYYGYIFQSYNLINNMTVEENLTVALRLVGVTDKQETRVRVDEVLRAVGMTNYRNRIVTSMSGGQQQRVVIARALIKSPKIIVADEPTGNLDDKNTIAIMDILKQISKTRLVLLVTHEPRLVEFYADRVIELSDGKVINDQEVNEERSLNYKDSRKIYLKDMPVSEGAVENVNIASYGKSSGKVGIKLIYSDNNLYVEVVNTDNLNVKIVDKTSEVRLIDDHYRERKSNVVAAAAINEDIIKPVGKYKYSGYTTFGGEIKSTFAKMFGKHKKTEVFTYVVLALVTVLITIMSAVYIFTVSPDGQMLRKTPDNAYVVNGGSNISKNVLNQMLRSDAIQYMYLGGQYSNYGTYSPNLGLYNGENNGEEIDVYCVSADNLKESDIKYGRLPENNKEIVIGIDVFTYGGEYELSRWKIDSVNDFIGIEASISTNRWDSMISSKLPYEAKIVGVTEKYGAAVYVTDFDMIPYQFSSVVSASHARKMGFFVSDAIDTVTSVGDDKIRSVISYNPYDVQNGNNPLIIQGSAIDYSIYGLFHVIETRYVDYTDDLPDGITYIVSDVVYDEMCINNLTSNMDISINVFAADKEAFEQFADNNNLEYVNALTYNNEWNKSILESSLLLIGIVIGVCVAVTVICIFFLMRSSVIGKVQQIGIMRAIGVSKWDIYRAQILEILTLMLFSTLIGFIIGLSIGKAILDMMALVYSVWVGLIVLFGLLFTHLFFGLLPLFGIMSKPPAQILTKYDI